MTDLSATIEPKSDQLNADDLIAGPRTITVTRVTGGGGNEQPVSIHFDGDKGKPYKPCKSMRRVMVLLWGKDGATYTGRSMTLYRDATVQFGGDSVGGIRISHMTHIEGEHQLMLTATRGKRAPYMVRPLEKRVRVTLDQALARIADTSDVGALNQTLAALRTEKWSKEDGAAIAAASEQRKQVFTSQREPGED